MAIRLAGYATLPDGSSLDEVQSWMVACLHTTNCVIGRRIARICGQTLRFLTIRHIEERGDGRTGI
ncbi:hypothetical protein GGD66_005001 [Bradyrhizobium sp. CIR48]|nr:hypothetical protein [Bradyrhizobium sp. CIR48]